MVGRGARRRAERGRLAIAAVGHGRRRTDHRAEPACCCWFTSLLLAYTLEGVGYIIAGTFLVAAIDQTASPSLGSSAWILVGVAAVPSAALWAGLSRIWSRPTLLAVALGAQAIGIALPALIGGTTAALASAVLFGATFLGVATVALATGAHLRTPRAVAILTTGYSVGQIAGPVLVTPMLHHSYQPALLVGAVIVAVAAVAALMLRHRFPHYLDPNPAATGCPATEEDDDGIPGRHDDHGAGWHHGRGGRRDPDPGGGTTRELAAQGHLVELWRPPLKAGEWRTWAPVPGRRRDRTGEACCRRCDCAVWRHDTVTMATLFVTVDSDGVA